MASRFGSSKPGPLRRVPPAIRTPWPTSPARTLPMIPPSAAPYSCGAVAMGRSSGPERSSRPCPRQRPDHRDRPVARPRERLARGRGLVRWELGAIPRRRRAAGAPQPRPRPGRGCRGLGPGAGALSLPGNRDRDGNGRAAPARIGHLDPNAEDLTQEQRQDIWFLGLAGKGDADLRDIAEEDTLASRHLMS